MSGSSLAEWTDMPRIVSEHQRAWERRQRALTAWKNGARLKEIALKMGVSCATVSHWIKKTEMQIRWKWRSPAERWIAQQEVEPSLAMYIKLQRSMLIPQKIQLHNGVYIEP